MIKLQNSEDDQFYFTIVADNGEVVATSQVYTKKDKAIQTAKIFPTLSFEIGDFTKKRRNKKAGS